jgi:outer membrane protein OmpU
MKKILLAGTAIAGVALLSQPAHADLKLDLGGYFRGYAVYADNDENDVAGENLRTFNFTKDAEVHFTGETTTDMGLTVGAHFEVKMLGNGGSYYNGTTNFGPNQYPYYYSSANAVAGPLVDESYLYFSGGWGRVNFGAEDGAAYLLQVAAPSADSNVDGLRPTIQGFNSDVWNNGNADVNWVDPWSYSSSSNVWTNTVLGYDNADFRHTDRITYLTPKWNGFQAGVSYAPTQGLTQIEGGTSGMPWDDATTGASFENLWEASARWDGEFSGVGISVGGGYSSASPENESGIGAGNFGSDDLQTWDAGLNLTWQGWSLGGAYKHSNTGTSGANTDYRVWDVGLGWDNGPWHAGASWWNGKWDENVYGGAYNLTDDLKIDRYTIGGGYTYGPGMSFRGAVAWMNTDTGVAAADTNPVQVTLGTDVNF